MPAILNQSAQWEHWENKHTASCLSVSSWQTSIEIHPYPHTLSHCSLIGNQTQLLPSVHLPAVERMCTYMCVNSSMMCLYCPTSVSKCIITGVQELPWLILEIVNPCLTQLDSQPPFESSLHSQLWGAAHRGSQKHLQSWNGVWDLCSDYTGTSRVHILSHDSLRQNKSSVWLSRKQSKAESTLERCISSSRKMPRKCTERIHFSLAV